MQSYDPSSPWNLNYERALLGNILLCADADRQPKPGFEKVPPENYFLLDHQQLVEGGPNRPGVRMVGGDARHPDLCARCATVVA